MLTNNRNENHFLKWFELSFWSGSRDKKGELIAIKLLPLRPQIGEIWTLPTGNLHDHNRMVSVRINEVDLEWDVQPNEEWNLDIVCYCTLINDDIRNEQAHNKELSKLV